MKTMNFETASMSGKKMSLLEFAEGFELKESGFTVRLRKGTMAIIYKIAQTTGMPVSNVARNLIQIGLKHIAANPNTARFHEYETMEERFTMKIGQSTMNTLMKLSEVTGMSLSGVVRNLIQIGLQHVDY
jgi:hypothetical protein